MALKIFFTGSAFYFFIGVAWLALGMSPAKPDEKQTHMAVMGSQLSWDDMFTMLDLTEFYAKKADYANLNKLSEESRLILDMLHERLPQNASSNDKELLQIFQRNYNQMSALIDARRTGELVEKIQILKDQSNSLRVALKD